MINDDLMKAAIEKWGIDLQIDLAQEECAELIETIAHYRRGRLNSNKKLIEEIADVKIMIRQLEMMFGEDEVDLVVQQKMDRLSSRLNRNVYDEEKI